MTNLHDLFAQEGQSPWLDNLRHDWLVSGEVQRWVDRGVRGITSNPTIFQKAMAAGEAYDEQFGQLVAEGRSVDEAYWEMVVTDIGDALAILRPVHDESGGEDGYVSVEVDPGLARDTAGTVQAAHDLHARIDAPNLYVKIPGTSEGIDAIRQTIAAGKSVNVTLLFSLSRYDEVIEAYLSGLEACEGSLAGISSVASFFVSRVDAAIDKLLAEIGTDEALALRGKAAVANAQLAYELFLQRFAGPRWERLVERGARLQRPLWASTSTKDPSYPKTMYVDALIAPDTVDTMPEDTLEAFDEGGTVARTADADLDGARAVAAALEAVGIDLDDVTRRLEDEGVAAFEKSFEELSESLQAKAHALSPELTAPMALPGELVVTDDVPGAFAARMVAAYGARPNDTFSIALSGGETARACYERLAEESGTRVDWWKVDVYWTDERCVPHDHADSNYRLAREALLDRVGAANATYLMRCTEGPDPYQLRVGELGRFDLEHLGMGADGHTASLFPDSPALDADPGLLVTLNRDPSGRNEHDRMTLTFAGISRSRLAVVTVRGEEKAAALAAVAGGADLPAAHIAAEHVLWLVDAAAASRL